MPAEPRPRPAWSDRGISAGSLSMGRHPKTVSPSRVHWGARTVLLARPAVGRVADESVSAAVVGRLHEDALRTRRRRATRQRATHLVVRVAPSVWLAGPLRRSTIATTVRPMMVVCRFPTPSSSRTCGACGHRTSVRTTLATGPQIPDTTRRPRCRRRAPGPSCRAPRSLRWSPTSSEEP